MLHIDPDSKLAKVTMVVAVLPGATVVLWLELWHFFRSMRSTQWPGAQGIVLESRVHRGNVHGIPTSSPQIRYSYSVNGRQYENDTIAFGLTRGSLTWGYADRKVERFARGKAVEVYYDPDRPNDACLETGGLGWEDPLCLCLAVAGICLGMKVLGHFLIWLFRPRNLVLVK